MIPLLSFLWACQPKPQPVESPVQTGPARIHHERPASLERKPFSVPTLTKGTLSNGVDVYVNSNHKVPLVRIWLSLDAGSWTDPDDQIGLAQASMDMLDEGSQNITGAELSQKLRALGSTLKVQSGRDGSVIRIQSLKSNLNQTLELISQVVQQPLFSESIWERKQKEYIQNLAQTHSQPRNISRLVAAKLLYGNKYVGRLQKEEHILSINTSAMQKWYQNHLRPEHAQFWVGGATSLEEITPLLEQHFSSWQSQSTKTFPKKPSAISLEEPTRSFIYMVDVPNASQSVIRFAQGVSKETDPESTALKVANQCIGGMFTARINSNLREDKGWTYGAWSWLSYNYFPGSFNIGTSVVTQYTPDAIREIVRELRESKSQRPITQEELDRAKGDLLGTFPSNFEKSSYLINSQLGILRYDLEQDWVSNYESRISAIDLKTAQEVWNKTIDPESMFIIVVGDQTKLQPKLLELGYTIIPIDSYAQKRKP